MHRTQNSITQGRKLTLLYLEIADCWVGIPSSYTQGLMALPSTTAICMYGIRDADAYSAV